MVDFPNALASLLAPPEALQRNQVAPVQAPDMSGMRLAPPDQMAAQRAPGVLAGLMHPGKARDIIGSIGDAFLLQGGQKPMYSQFQDRQDAGGALQGLKDDPMGTVAKLAQVDPDAALQLYQHVTANNIAQSNQDRLGANLDRQNRLADAQVQGEQDKMLGAARSMMAAATAQNYPQVRARVEQFLTSRKIDPSLLGLPDQYDADAIKNIEMAGVPVAKQFQQAETSRYHDAAIAQGNAGLGVRSRDVNSEIGRRGQQNYIDEQQIALGKQRLAEETRHNQESERISATKGRHATVSLPPLPPRHMGDMIKNGSGDTFVAIKSGTGLVWTRK